MSGGKRDRRPSENANNWVRLWETGTSWTLLSESRPLHSGFKLWVTCLAPKSFPHSVLCHRNPLFIAKKTRGPQGRLWDPAHVVGKCGAPRVAPLRGLEIACQRVRLAKASFHELMDHSCQEKLDLNGVSEKLLPWHFLPEDLNRCRWLSDLH